MISNKAVCYCLDTLNGEQFNIELTTRVGKKCDKYFPAPIAARFEVASIFLANQTGDNCLVVILS